MEDKKDLIKQLKGIIEKENNVRDQKLQAICKLLSEKVAVFDWVGFYIADPAADRELMLGPFVGEPTEHTRIAFGEGICGQAAETNQTFVVQDVNEENNYLSCSPQVKAEIVVPVKKNGQFVAELDIDSHTKNALTEEHKTMLEEICDQVAVLF